MCGIAGIAAFNRNGSIKIARLGQAVESLAQRGPDGKGQFIYRQVGLGHTRLKVMDKSDAAAQPMQAEQGRYHIVFNGEIYNYTSLRKEMRNRGVRFVSQSDTEVLLRMFILEREACLEQFNGCFAFAVYDKKKDQLFIARDRIGIKPLYYYHDDNAFLFASGLRALCALGIPQTIDKISLFTYLQLNYIPAPNTIYKNVCKLLPGHYLEVNGIHSPDPRITVHRYYQIPYAPDKVIQPAPASYAKAKKRLVELLGEAVEKRMMAEVPLGAFLSGGVDSSIIAFIASACRPGLRTFSIGYEDQPYFDETAYAEKVAAKIGSEHTVYKLKSKDMLNQLYRVLDDTDEPFADSSAIAVNVLSERCRRSVTVALSGDGADELFGGYNKHFAEWKARHPGVLEQIIKWAFPVFSKLPQNRNSVTGNIGRQLRRYGEGIKLGKRERYWRWASFLDEEGANYLLKEQYRYKPHRLSDDAYTYKKRKESVLKYIHKEGDINDVLLADMHLVLPGDMLYKVDRMSMSYGLEVRTPYLDHKVVEFAFSLPAGFKIQASLRKKILQDAFSDQLPPEIYNRPKKGFEVPMLQWLRYDLKSEIARCLNTAYLTEQGIFNPEGVQSLLQRLFSRNPGDAHASVWAVLVFQHWWEKNQPDNPRM